MFQKSLLLIVTAAVLLAAVQTPSGEPPTAEAASLNGNGTLLVRIIASGMKLASMNLDGSGQTTLATGSNGSWSPDGKRIVYDTQYNGTADISIMDADGSNVVPIFVGPSADVLPTWSPDGERIAFASTRGASGFGLYSARADGSDVVQLTDWDTIRVEGNDPPKWSPDGTRILFIGQEPESGGGGPDGGPAESGAAPNGGGGSGTSWDLYTVSPSGGGLTRLTNSEAKEFTPEWSPDGTKITFGTYDSGALWVMPAGGGGASQIATMAGTGFQGVGPVWSPDGKRIAYTEVSGFPLVFASHLIDAGGGSSAALSVSGTILDWQPVPATKVEFTQGIQVLQSIGELQESLALGWTQPFATQPQAALPPSGRILLKQPVGNIYQTFSIDGDGTNLRQISNHTASTDVPNWSPDGEEIAFFAYVDASDVTSMAIFTESASGGGATQLTKDDGTQDTYPYWSPLGDEIAYTSTTYPQDPNTGETLTVREARVMNAGGSGDHRLAADAFALGWSPDGSQIALRDMTDHSLWAVNADGSGKRQISSTDVGICDWSPDGEQLACHDTALPQAIKLISVVTGTATTIKGNAHSPVWSPDGKEIAFTAYDSGRISIMDTTGGNVRDLVEGMGPYDWIGPALVSAEFTQGIQVLQSIKELQSDISGDGKPPVPIVAGKPAAMRVYFDDVQQTTTYTVEVSGEFTGSDTITLNPGCDVDQRRKQLNNCKSVDFYFTPPEGNWTVKLEVKDSGGTVVEDHEFKLTSDESDAIVLKAVSLCDAVSPGLFGQWSCQDPSGLLSTASLLRRMLPTDEVYVSLTGSSVKQQAANFAQPIQWWGQVDRDLQAMYGVSDALSSALGHETYYFGVARNAVPGGTLGAAYITTRGAAAKASYTGLGYEAIPWVVAHEFGHAAGLDHTNTAAPPLAGGSGCWLGTATNLAWPYADNMLRSGAAPGDVEVGFDVANKVTLPGDLYFDFSGYCSSAPTSQAPDATVWISPFTANYLLEPTGPLSAGAGEPQAAPATAPADYWLLQGQIDQGAAVFDPLFTFSLDGTPSPAPGSHRIEVRDASASLLITRMFTPAVGHGSPSPGDPVLNTPASFSELIPVQPGAALIQVFDGFNTPIGQIALTGTAPSVTITQAANDGDAITLEWSVDDPDSTEHTYWVDYSPDGGTTWQNQAMGLTDAALALDADLLAGSDNAVVRVIASDGVNSGEANSAAFTVAGKLPHADIIGPQRTSFRQGDLVWLEAAAWDLDDGTLDGSAVTWSSSRDGNLGSGASLPVYDLSNGSHTITMTARDSDNNTVTDTITVTVTDSPLVEGEEPGDPHIWGDNDCDGEITSRDNQALSRKVLQQPPLSQTLPCPALGDAVSVGGASLAWGDLDCDGEITSRDGQALLRKVLAQNALSQTQPCPVIGDTVAVASVAQTTVTSAWRERLAAWLRGHRLWPFQQLPSAVWRVQTSGTARLGGLK